jgi:serine protease Do
LRSGDVILSVDGVSTVGTPQFMEQVGQLRPGDHVRLEFFRNGSTRQASVLLSDRRNATLTEGAEINHRVLASIGMQVRELSEREKTRLRTNGVLVERIDRGSVIADTNMENDYIITKINGQEVHDVNDLVDALTYADGMIVLDGFYEKYPGDYPYAFRKE